MIIKQILIVEDDADINNLLAEILKRGGYKAVQAYSGTEARLLLEKHEYSLLLLDLMLPGITGEEIISLLRKSNDNTPIIVLSAKDTPQDKITALHIGADDYITKPFDEGELLARIEAALRRAGHEPSLATKKLIYQDICLEPETRTVTVSGSPVSLTAREFDILALLMSNPKKVFTKSNLFRSVWNDEFLGDDNTVNVHISNLRSKLGSTEYIKTVWGIGFKLADEPSLL